MNQFDENKFNEQPQNPTQETPQNTEPQQKTLVQALKEIFASALQKTFVKVGIAVVAALIIILVISAMNNPVQDDLLDYINNDMQTVAELESKTVDLYDEAREDTASDYEMYLMLRDEVLPVAREWSEATEDIEVETEEVREVHELYIKMVNENCSGMTLMLSALENQDYAQITQANEKLDSARKLGRDYQAELSKLMEEHDVVYE